MESEKLKKLKEKLEKDWDIESKPWEICLHSYQYKLEGKVYQTAKPYWADPDYRFQKWLFIIHFICIYFYACIL